MKFSTITLSVLLLAAIAYAGYLQSQLNRLKAGSFAEGASAQVADVESPSSVGDDAQSLGDAGSALAVVENVDEPVGPPSRDDRQARRKDRLKQMLAPFEDPDMRMDMIERQMARVDSRYAGFFKTLNLSPDELDTLRTLMAEESVVNDEMRMRGFGAETEEEKAAADAERKYQRDLIEEQIASVLGEENAAALKDYSDTLPYRGEVAALATSLSFTDTPLSDGQSETLVNAIRDVSTSFEYSVDLSNMRGREIGAVNPSDIDAYFSERAARDDMVLQAASESLSDAQLAAYAESQIAERERDRRQLEYMQQNPTGGFGRNGPRGGGGGPRGGGRP